ncbi:Calcium-transporting ATPase 10 plasma membrane-type [Dissostichus eleginoides]|uniref:Calcium-transporting ATPase 10 plasma membrane-type n=1 Tax=Dissostichus eleginoides TaxID=100907 RepID=A0AAD9BNV2_DISEL|nr:Calcium-transporting ATPase 10 plasma membrane-type [Dissostichus eleginoides]
MPIQFIHRPACLSALALGRDCGWGVGGVVEFLKTKIWGIKSGCRGLLNRQDQARVEGVSAAGEQGFDSPLSSTVVSLNNRQLKVQGPGLRGQKGILDRALVAPADGIGPTRVQPHVSASYYCSQYRTMWLALWEAAQDCVALYRGAIIQGLITAPLAAYLLPGDSLFKPLPNDLGKLTCSTSQGCGAPLMSEGVAPTQGLLVLPKKKREARKGPATATNASLIQCPCSCYLPLPVQVKEPGPLLLRTQRNSF